MTGDKDRGKGIGTEDRDGSEQMTGTGGQVNRERDTEIGARTDGQGHWDGGTIDRCRESDRGTVTG